MAAKHTSIYEHAHGMFLDTTIAAAGQPEFRAAAGMLMQDLNQMHQILSGLGVVMRIVVGNSVVEDRFNTESLITMPPLSKTAEAMLTTMVASVCEQMRDQIELRAADYNDRAKS